MTDMADRTRNALDAGGGILQMVPNWVPRSLSIPGRRLRLAPEDLYALGAERGGIDERWFSSTIRADNGPGTPEDEGLSYFVDADGRTALFRDAIQAAGADVIGHRSMDVWGRWPVYCKLFDNRGPIPHHLHPRNEHLETLGREHKPEAYYFPPQYNPVENDFPYTFFGLAPGTEPDDVRRCLERWDEGDNRILDLSRAYRLTPETGWLVPPGVLHAPGSLCTYEVQWASDVAAMYQSMVDGRPVPWDWLVKDVPEAQRNDLDYLVELLDWDANVDPYFRQKHRLDPVTARDVGNDVASDRWIIHGTILGEDLFSAKELTVDRGGEIIVQDEGACGILVVQGSGKIGPFRASAPTYVRYGDMLDDEFFVSHDRATEGYRVRNDGVEPLVLLRYFGPGAQRRSARA